MDAEEAPDRGSTAVQATRRTDPPTPRKDAAKKMKRPSIAAMDGIFGTSTPPGIAAALPTKENDEMAELRRLVEKLMARIEELVETNSRLAEKLCESTQPPQQTREPQQTQRSYLRALGARASAHNPQAQQARQAPASAPVSAPAPQHQATPAPRTAPRTAPAPPKAPPIINQRPKTQWVQVQVGSAAPLLNPDQITDAINKDADKPIVSTTRLTKSGLYMIHGCHGNTATRLTDDTKWVGSFAPDGRIIRASNWSEILVHYVNRNEDTESEEYFQMAQEKIEFFNQVTLVHRPRWLTKIDPVDPEKAPVKPKTHGTLVLTLYDAEEAKHLVKHRVITVNQHLRAEYSKRRPPKKRERAAPQAAEGSPIASGDPAPRI